MNLKTYEGGVWEVQDDGRMLYHIGDMKVFEIEPEVLTNPDRYRFMKHTPGINHYEYFLHWIRACEKAGLDTTNITINLK